MHLNIWMTLKTEQGGWWMVSFTDRRAPQDPPQAVPAVPAVPERAPLEPRPVPPGNSMDFRGDLPSGYVKIAIEHGDL